MKTRKKNGPGRVTPDPAVNGTRETSSASETPTKPALSAKPKQGRKPAFTLKQERGESFRALSFPEVAGKKTASVQMITSDDYHAVYIVFDDNTAVGFEIEPGFTIHAFAGDIEGIGPGAKKTWPEIRSER